MDISIFVDVVGVMLISYKVWK